jgi:hypothetical protein
MVDLLSLEECVVRSVPIGSLATDALRQTAEDYTTILAPSPTAVVAEAPSAPAVKKP